MQIQVEEHPLLDAKAFISRLDQPLSERPSPTKILQFFAPETPAPFAVPESTKTMIRDLLRYGGFKPTGRSKPASEYLIKAVEKGWFSTGKGINLAVDTCNVVSLKSGLPISVVDADLLLEPLSIGINPAKTEYIFNPSGQTIDIGMLFGLRDSKGPCAGPVKDSQRTKTHDGTIRTLSIIWGTRDLPGHTDKTLRWYQELMGGAGAQIENIELCAQGASK